MFKFRRREGPTKGKYYDAIGSVLNTRVLSGPSQEWLDQYNLRALENELGLNPPLLSQLGLDRQMRFPPTALIFSPDMPSVFYEDEIGKPYRGNQRAKERIDNRIRATWPGERIKFLLTGFAGTGKTSLAWIIVYRIMAHRIRNGQEPGRFFEILAGQIEEKSQWDIFMRQLLPNDNIFIDEVHVLNEVLGVEALYPVLADTGMPRYPLGNGEGWIEVPEGVSWLAATTDPGLLDPALRRRFEPEIRLDTPTVEDLTYIVLDQDMPVEEQAAFNIALRSGGLPWQAINIYNEARAIARTTDRKRIEAEEAEKAFTAIGVDENGLLPEDRTIIASLLKTAHRMADGRIVHKMSEAALCAAAGLDKTTFKERVQPKLLKLGLLTVAGGQVLTPLAEEWYGQVVDS